MDDADFVVLQFICTSATIRYISTSLYHSHVFSKSSALCDTVTQNCEFGNCPN